MSDRINIDLPLWNQDTFIGRFKHFLWVTDPRSCFVNDEELYKAKELLEKYRLGKEPKEVSLEQIKYAKKLYESAFHPDSGELQNVFGRMSFQLPGGMAITGAMLQFYKTTPAIFFWQWVNQSFNALVNYTNRNAKSPISTTQLCVAYVSATTSALVTAIGLKNYLAKNASPFFQRYVPFSAVAAANFVNIPLMRQTEIINGVDLSDINDNVVGRSRYAAVKGIGQVVVSRIIMCAPGMLVLPIIMERLEKYNWMKRIHLLHMPIQVLLVGCFLTVMVPTACAIFPQKCEVKLSTIKFLEPERYEEILEKCEKKPPQLLYFNKGL